MGRSNEFIFMVNNLIDVVNGYQCLGEYNYVSTEHEAERMMMTMLNCLLVKKLDDRGYDTSDLNTYDSLFWNVGAIWITLDGFDDSINHLLIEFDFLNYPEMYLTNAQLYDKYTSRPEIVAVDLIYLINNIDKFYNNNNLSLTQ
jgi:hypothetical protein